MVTQEKVALTKQEAVYKIFNILRDSVEDTSEQAMFDNICSLTRDFKKIEVLDDLIHFEGYQFTYESGIGQPLLNAAHQGFSDVDKYLWKLYDCINDIRDIIDQTEWVERCDHK